MVSGITRLNLTGDSAQFARALRRCLMLVQIISVGYGTTTTCFGFDQDIFRSYGHHAPSRSCQAHLCAEGRRPGPHHCQAVDPQTQIDFAAGKSAPLTSGTAAQEHFLRAAAGNRISCHRPHARSERSCADARIRRYHGRSRLGGASEVSDSREAVHGAST